MRPMPLVRLYLSVDPIKTGSRPVCKRQFPTQGTAVLVDMAFPSIFFPGLWGFITMRTELLLDNFHVLCES